MNKPWRVLLIDDHPLMRRGLAELLAANGDYQVIGMASEGQTGLQLARELQPDMILLDWHMPGLGGLATLSAFKNELPDTTVLVLTASDARDDLLAALHAGADGYLLKDREPEVLLDTLQACRTGRAPLDPMLLGLLARGLRDAGPLPAATAVGLTDRELQTLVLIAEGMSNKLIARQLGISDGTVKIHVKHLLGKLGLHSRLEMAAWVYRHGLPGVVRGEPA
ncbi:MAG: DNA-binding response regulator [Pseudomonadaceae bacterium]|nr:DNA-binding response regulator [Pseudomonadaceae bacterium]HCP55368.1 DNA-binding response regulator [Pseudomonas sp.]